MLTMEFSYCNLCASEKKTLIKQKYALFFLTKYKIGMVYIVYNFHRMPAKSDLRYAVQYNMLYIIYFGILSVLYDMCFSKPFIYTHMMCVLRSCAIWAELSTSTWYSLLHRILLYHFSSVLLTPFYIRFIYLIWHEHREISLSD